MDEPVVHVVDDDASVRDSLLWLLESIGLTVHCYDSAASFEQGCDLSHPGCLILDVRMPGISGLDLQEKLVGHNLSLPIIIVTGHADVPMAIRAMKNGAFDFIEKPYNDQYMLDRVQEAIQHSATSLSKEMLQQQTMQRVQTLTPREKEVMHLISQGCSNKEAAVQLDLSVKTVETHRSHVMAKMHANSLPALIRQTMAIDNPD
jgi:FixJ family two-component response regulator